MSIGQAMKKFRESMDDDFGTPGALAALFELQGLAITESIAAMVRSPQRSLVQHLQEAFGQVTDVLGMTFKPVVDESSSKVARDLVSILLQQREEARKAKDFAAADAIRAQLDSVGVIVEDKPSGPTWRLKSQVSLKLS